MAQTNVLLQIRRLRCATQPKRSSTAAEIAAVNQELQAVQAETEIVLHDQEVSMHPTCILASCMHAATMLSRLISCSCCKRAETILAPINTVACLSSCMLQ